MAGKKFTSPKREELHEQIASLRRVYLGSAPDVGSDNSGRDLDCVVFNTLLIPLKDQPIDEEIGDVGPVLKYDRDIAVRTHQAFELNAKDPLAGFEVPADYQGFTRVVDGSTDLDETKSSIYYSYDELNVHTDHQAVKSIVSDEILDEPDLVDDVLMESLEEQVSKSIVGLEYKRNFYNSMTRHYYVYRPRRLPIVEELRPLILIFDYSLPTIIKYYKTSSFLQSFCLAFNATQLKYWLDRKSSVIMSSVMKIDIKDDCQLIFITDKALTYMDKRAIWKERGSISFIVECEPDLIVNNLLAIYGYQGVMALGGVT